MSMIIGAPETDQLTTHQRAIQAALEAIGWELEIAHVNLASDMPSAHLSLRRADGLILTFDSQHGRATLTRERPSIASRGARYSQWQNHLMGRDKWLSLGVRSDLKRVGHYLGDNPAPRIAPDRKLGLNAMRALIDRSNEERP